MISAQELVALLGAITALLVALGAIYGQVRSTHQLVNSRMEELLAITRSSAYARGELDERRRPGRSSDDPGQLPPAD